MTYAQELLKEAVEAMSYIEQQDWYDEDLSSITDVRKKIVLYLDYVSSSL